MITRTCQFYAVGKESTELLAIDEMDAIGSGYYYTDDAFMIERYSMSEAVNEARIANLNVFLVTIVKMTDYKVEVVRMFDYEEIISGKVNLSQ